jgi:hypothetical protein
LFAQAVEAPERVVDGQDLEAGEAGRVVARGPGGLLVRLGGGDFHGVSPVRDLRPRSFGRR